MKKFIYIFVIIALLAIIMIETPVFVNYMFRKEAIKLLEKANYYTNIKIVSREKNGDENEKITTTKYRTDIALISEGEEYINWSSTTNNQMYMFWKNIKVCNPTYENTLEESTLLINVDDIEGLKYTDLLDLKFRNIEYNGKKCLEIMDGNFSSIYDKETGLCLKEYMNNYQVTYEYEIDKLTEEDMKLNFEGYIIHIEENDEKYLKSSVENDENLPREFVENYKNNKEKL